MPDTAAPIAFSGLPLFPLATTLFPGGRLGLRVFEERYLRALPGCFLANAPFGVVTLMQGREVLGPNAPPEQFHPIGTLARIAVLEQIGPGLLYLECEGKQRFRVLTQQRLSSGLWIADASRVDPDRRVTVPDDLKPVARALLHTRQSSQPGSNTPLPSSRTDHYDDCGWVANRWGEMLPMPLADRHRLMSLENPLLRLELVADMLGPARLKTGDEG